MKTCMWTTSWLDGKDALGSSRLERTKRYLDYYRPLKKVLGFDYFHMSDNASAFGLIDEVVAYNNDYWASDLFIHRFDKGLYKIYHDDGGHEFPYCWRGLYFLQELIARGYEKIIICDTDAFILSGRMADYIRNCNSGYHTFWCPKLNMPAAEISVLNEDAFPAFTEWCKTPWEVRSASRVLMEAAPPFTHINKQFMGDRYGEFTHEGSVGRPQEDWMDYYTQAQVRFPMTFRPHGNTLGSEAHLYIEGIYQ